MKEVKNYAGEIVQELELSDIEVGKQYIGGKYIQPSYLSGSVLTVVKLSRKNVKVTHPAYGKEQFAVSPSWLLLKETT